MSETSEDEMKLIEARLSAAEPEWLIEQRYSPVSNIDTRTFHGPGVIDIGKGGVFIDPPSITNPVVSEPDDPLNVSGLPAGTENNQILYYDIALDSWELLQPVTPSAEELAILTINTDGALSWTLAENITLDYVDDNNEVATGNFLKLPTP